jgi:hypothetical protein
MEKSISERISSLEWSAIAPDLHDRGFVIVKNVLTPGECGRLINEYNADEYRKTISMERYRFGSGEYKYFKYPLPEIITDLRENVYARIAPVANSWMEELGIDTRFPPTHAGMKEISHQARQTKPTVLILNISRVGLISFTRTLRRSLLPDADRIYARPDR